MPILTGLFHYPVKSLGGVQASVAEVTPTGLDEDRRWMLVDGDGRFLTQREHPQLARIRVVPEGDGLTLVVPGLGARHVARPAASIVSCSVTVWRDQCLAQPADEAVQQWLRQSLGRDDLRLIYMPDSTIRKVSPQHAREGDRIGFADGYPFLLISQASLDDLNGRMATPLPMSRFRPNLVVDDCPPFAEDGWRRVRIGGIEFRVVKPCSRCKVTTIDQLTGEAGQEPLKTLASYRRRDNEVWFGMNLVHEGTGRVELGAAVEVLA